MLRTARTLCAASDDVAPGADPPTSSLGLLQEDDRDALSDDGDGAAVAAAAIKATSPRADGGAGDGDGDFDGVRFLLCTVTLHANHAHNLTRSP